MEYTGLGGGVMLAIAAGLWMIYLVPSWLRRREYLSTERNAVRLQQTLRVLAETAEVPVAVRAETTARGVAAQQRSLRQAQQRAALVARARDAEARAREAAAARAAASIANVQPVIAELVAARMLASRRLRRTRAVTTLVLLASLATSVVQVVLMITTGVAANAWTVLGVSAVAGISSFVLLGRLASVARARAAAVAAGRPVRRTSLGARSVVTRAETWTPIPLPKPAYLSRAVIQAAAIDTAAAVAELQAASADADNALRSLPVVEPVETPVETRFEPRPIYVAREPEPEPASRYAAMGFVDVPPTATTDLDEVLRRRRAAG
jgi:hypothetical protein